MANKLKGQPKRIGGWFYRKLPWYGKILVPLVMLAGAVYLIDSIMVFFA